MDKHRVKFADSNGRSAASCISLVMIGAWLFST